MKTNRKWMMFLCAMLAVCLILPACTPQIPPPADPVYPTTEVLAPPTEQTQAPTTQTTEPPTEPPTEPVPEPVPELARGILQQMCSEGGLQMALFTDKGIVYGPFVVYNRVSNMNMETGMEHVEPQDVSGITEWIEFENSDGSRRLTVYRANPDIVKYEVNGQTYWFLAAAQEDENRSLEAYLRRSVSVYVHNAFGRVRFACDGGAADILEEYVTNAYPTLMDTMPNGTIYDFADYQALSWEVTENRGDVVVGNISYAVQYALPEGLAGGMMIDGGKETPGTDEYEGWSIIDRQVILEQHSDGLWYEVDNNDYTVASWDGVRENEPPAVDPESQRAKDAAAFLDSMSEEVAKLGSSEQDLIALSNLFLKCTTALENSGRESFDWNLICTEDALNHLGVQSLFKGWNVGGFFNGDMNGEYKPQMVVINNDAAMVYHYEATLYFRMVDGRWMVDDVVRPYAGT